MGLPATPLPSIWSGDGVQSAGKSGEEVMENSSAASEACGEEIDRSSAAFEAWFSPGVSLSVKSRAKVFRRSGGASARMSEGSHPRLGRSVTFADGGGRCDAAGLPVAQSWHIAREGGDGDGSGRDGARGGMAGIRYGQTVLEKKERAGEGAGTSGEGSGAGNPTSCFQDIRGEGNAPMDKQSGEPATYLREDSDNPIGKQSDDTVAFPRHLRRSKSVQQPGNDPNGNADKTLAVPALADTAILQAMLPPPPVLPTVTVMATRADAITRVSPTLIENGGEHTQGYSLATGKQSDEEVGGYTRGYTHTAGRQSEEDEEDGGPARELSFGAAATSEDGEAASLPGAEEAEVSSAARPLADATSLSAAATTALPETKKRQTSFFSGKMPTITFQGWSRKKLITTSAANPSSMSTAAAVNAGAAPGTPPSSEVGGVVCTKPVQLLGVEGYRRSAPSVSSRDNIGAMVDVDALHRLLAAAESNLQATRLEREALVDELAMKEELIQAREFQLATTTELCASQREELTERETEVEERDALLKARVADIAARDSLLEARNADVAARDSLLKARNADVAARDSLLEACNADMAVRDSLVESLRVELGAAKAQLAAVAMAVAATVGNSTEL